MCFCFVLSDIMAINVYIDVVACDFRVIPFFHTIKHILIRVHFYIFRFIRSRTDGELNCCVLAIFDISPHACQTLASPRFEFVSSSATSNMSATVEGSSVFCRKICICFQLASPSSVRGAFSAIKAQQAGALFLPCVHSGFRLRAPARGIPAKRARQVPAHRGQ